MQLLAYDMLLDMDSQKAAETVTKYLSRTNGLLVQFLRINLPAISAKWWEEAVIDKLSYTQLERIRKSNITSLERLDLAALLRVFDQNWHEISRNCNLSYEDRHFVKEMPSVRNRWAHVPSGGYSADDTYRDFDTMQRFLKVITEEKETIEEIKKIKQDIFNSQKPKNNDEANRSGIPENNKQFQPTQIVVLKSDRSKRGPVMSLQIGDPEDTVNVFIDGKIVPYYASQLDVDRPEKYHDLNSDEFHAYLSALEIRFPGMSNLFSLNAARVDFIPYQFRPVLRFIRADRPRMLIADSVGVGKTIEAGLILRELQARKDIRSILIICPKPLITEKKWLNEMKRFEESFVHLDGKLLRFCIDETAKDGVWPETYNKSIVPYSLFSEDLVGIERDEAGKKIKPSKKKKIGLIDLDTLPHFDLVIVDEAHHIRNSNTIGYQAVKYFCDNAEAAIFLTATPIQLGENDLYTLLNLLRPDLIIDPESFNHMAEPNPFINAAVSAMREKNSDWANLALEQLDKASQTSWGTVLLAKNPEFIEIKKQLNRKEIFPEERVKMITVAENLHSFSGIINRTRRRDIGEFTVRKPTTVKISFTSKQQQLHDALLQIQADILSLIHNNKNIAFMLTTIRRQAASCIYGLKPFLDEMLKRHLDELFWDVGSDDEAETDESFVSTIETQINELIAFANTLDDEDPKYSALLKIIKEKQALPNNRIMLFSTFRHTLYYLATKLQNDGFRAGVIHGGIPDEERILLRTKFEKAREETNAIDILLFSEVGCEGLDYQFCDCMINYDLPWNPMRIEQRIGRIDRQGQKSPAVAIYNLITQGTIDGDIFERCLSRIGVFEKSIGDCEEILGEITQKIKSIAEDFTLDEKSRQEKLDQLADNEIRHIQETEKLDEENYNFIGLRLPQEQLAKEIDEASNYWLNPGSLFRLVNLYLQKRIEKEQEFILGEKTLKTLRLSVEARSILLEDFRKLPLNKNPMYTKWEKWLKGSEQHLLMTFDADTAVNNLDTAFIMPLHPLVKQSADFFKLEGEAHTKLSVVSDVLPRADYPFAIYYWKLHGIREDHCLKIIADTDATTKQIEQLLKESVNNSAFNFSDTSENKWKELDDKHYVLWNTAKTDHIERNKQIIHFQRESLSISHKARMALLNDRLAYATHEKIINMIQGEIAKAGSDYSRHIQDFELAETKADVEFEPVAYGVLSVRSRK
jgi:SNF2 family DNA or RNA helicase/DNA-directed RNA polymerase subunit L